MAGPMRGADAGAEAVYRRRRVAGFLIVLALLVLVVNAGQWIEHARLSKRLDEELGERLLSLAKVAATHVDGEMIRRWLTWGVDANEEDRLRATLLEVLATESVSNLYLLDPDGGSILDLSGVLELGEFNTIVVLDQASFALAAAGIGAVSRLRSVDLSYIKAAYAPVASDDGEVVAVLAVEGGSQLFAVLRDVRRTTIAIAVASVVAIVLLGWILVRVTDSLTRAERGLLRAESLTTMGRMAAGIAHEVRNPLGIVRASAQRLARGLAPEGVALCGSIVEEVDRLNEIVTGYLNFAGDRPAQFRDLDLVDVVERALNSVASELRGVEVRASFGLAKAPIRGDPAQLRQVLLNLLLNARQAMPDGGELTVELDGRGDGSRGYELRVRDRGVGIPADRLRDVWKPFFTSKADGSGLGLTIARRIIEAHQGWIRIESRPGCGTTVRVELPPAPETS